MKKLPALLQKGVNLTPPLHNSACFNSIPPTSFQCYSLCFNNPPPCASLLLSMLHCYSSPCFVALFLSMFRCSLCFATPFTLLLFIVLHYSSCFIVVLPSASFLLLVLCCSYYFATMWCFATLHALLLYYPPRYLCAPCCFPTPSCFTIVQCFVTPLPILIFPPPLFFCNADIRNCLGRSLKAFKLPINLFCFLSFFFNFFFLVFLP